MLTTPASRKELEGSFCSFKGDDWVGNKDNIEDRGYNIIPLIKRLSATFYIFISFLLKNSYSGLQPVGLVIISKDQLILLLLWDYNFRFVTFMNLRNLNFKLRNTEYSQRWFLIMSS